MNLAVISTPGHYFNLLECLEQFKLSKKDFILVIFVVPNELSSIDFFSKINSKQFYRVIILNLWISNNKVSNFLSLINFIRLAIFYWVFYRFNYVVVNQLNAKYYRFFCLFMIYKHFISLDEGNAVLKLVEERKNNSNLKFIFRFPRKIIFFSSYDLDIIDSDVFIKNEYKYSKKGFLNKDLDNNSVIFVGNPYVEDGLMSEKSYFQYLDRIKKFFRNKKVFYFSHRRESDSKLIKVKNIFNFQISQNYLPIELYLLENELMPTIVSSFYSAALFNLKKMVDNPSVLFFSFRLKNDPNFGFDFRLLSDIYSKYEKSGIIVVEDF